MKGNFSMTDQPHVVILGAGFAGLGAMKELRDTPVKVTLIDKNDYHTFQPLLYQVATAELARTEVGFPAREMLHDRKDWVFHKAEVTGIDLDNKVVTANGLDPISYDYLIVALGAVVNFFGTKGAADNAYPLYTLGDAENLKRHILDRFEAVDKNPALVDDGALTFCVVGGGPTGVESAGAIAELIRDELKKDYPNLPVEKAEVHIFQRGPTLLPPLKPKLQQYAKQALEERDVQVHLGESVVEIEPDRLHLKSGNVMKAHTLVWGAGLTSNPIAGALGKELEKNRVPVDLDLRLNGHPEVFVIGDLAMITDSKTKEKLPQLGSVALQAGTHAGENITRLVKGKNTEPFKYKDKGTMATVGRGAAVVQFHGGRTMTGHAAWLAWLGVHLVLLSGGQERGQTVTDWGWEIMTHQRGKRIVID
jgi:NADH:ubiquinone reductase (H+-translocating)